LPFSARGNAVCDPHSRFGPRATQIAAQLAQRSRLILGYGTVWNMGQCEVLGTELLATFSEVQVVEPPLPTAGVRRHLFFSAVIPAWWGRSPDQGVGAVAVVWRARASPIMSVHSDSLECRKTFMSSRRLQSRGQLPVKQPRVPWPAHRTRRTWLGSVW
jgi:hypothetical protein